MKYKAALFKIAVLTSSSALSFLSVYYAWHTITRVDRAVCHVDLRLAPVARGEIVAFIDQIDSAIRARGTDFISAIINTFPYVSSVAISYLPHHNAHVYVRTHSPSSLINTNHVVLPTGALVARHYFAPHVCVDLPQVRVPDELLHSALLPDDVTRMLAAVPKGVRDNYIIVWEDSERVWLQDKDESRFSLLCEPDALPHERVLHACSRVRMDLYERGELAPRKKRRWVADVRFENQIVVSAKGGVRYGSHIC